jgi:2-succinyl-5-enolpyruvyl-6-hydroxy-3-cyclohexene-1-carboxylate synthase
MPGRDGFTVHESMWDCFELVTADNERLNQWCEKWSFMFQGAQKEIEALRTKLEQVEGERDALKVQAEQFAEFGLATVDVAREQLADLTAQLERARMPRLIRAALRRLINDPVVQTGAKFLSADLTDWLDQQEKQK